MKSVFADTHYWIAISRPHDSWQSAAKLVRGQLGEVALVTTDEVLVVFLSALAKRSPQMRSTAVSMARAILDDLAVRVIPQSRESFLAGLTLFENRPDKGYSLTDCISMNVMKTEGITETLTNGNHFVQEGFQVLIRR